MGNRGPSRIEIQEFAGALDLAGAVTALQNIIAWETKPGDGGAVELRQAARAWIGALGADDGERYLPVVRAFVLRACLRFESDLVSKFKRVEGLA